MATRAAAIDNTVGFREAFPLERSVRCLFCPVMKDRYLRHSVSALTEWLSGSSVIKQTIDVIWGA